MEHFPVNRDIFVSPTGARFWKTAAEGFLAIKAEKYSFYKRRQEYVIQLVQRHTMPCRFLDVGAADGDQVFKMCKLNYDAYGTDISEKMINAAIDKAHSAYPNEAHRFRLTQGDTAPFPFSFDVISVIGVLPYVEDHQRYLTYLSSMLAPNGLLIISCTAPRSLYTAYQLVKHLFNFKVSKSWWAISRNLFSSGIHSGGFVTRDCVQAKSYKALYKISAAAGYRKVDSLSLYNVQYADKMPFTRSRSGSFLAKLFGWTHIFMLRKIE